MHQCVHCGLCLNVCPTYLETGLETESPRGGIALMRAVAEDRITLSDRVMEHWDLCLLCRACEAACPSGVPYGQLMEAARTQTERQRPRSFVARSFGTPGIPGVASPCRTTSFRGGCPATLPAHGAAEKYSLPM